MLITNIRIYSQTNDIKKAQASFSKTERVDFAMKSFWCVVQKCSHSLMKVPGALLHRWLIHGKKSGEKSSQLSVQYSEFIIGCAIIDETLIGLNLSFCFFYAFSPSRSWLRVICRLIFALFVLQIATFFLNTIFICFVKDSFVRMIFFKTLTECF